MQGNRMRAGRLFLTLTCLTAVGIAAARPDVVLPLAQRYLTDALVAAKSVAALAVAVAEPALPATTADGNSDTQAAVDLGSSSTTEQKLPSFVSRAVDLKFNQQTTGSDVVAAPEAGTDRLPDSAADTASHAAVAAAVDVSVDTREVQSSAPSQPNNLSQPNKSTIADRPSATAALVPTVGEASSNVDNPDAAATAMPPSAVTGDRPSTPIVLSVEPIPPRGPVSGSAVEPGDAATPETGPPMVPAKSLFGAATTAAPLASRAIGSYSRGCLAGAVALPVDGPAWQAMRLSRNRNWGHPKLISLVERLALDAQKNDDWQGLLVGDISQPRGGPMLTGHASHQVGLDADVWLTPMPAKRFTRKEREDISATSMLDQTDLAVDPKVFTEKHVKLIKRAASYPEVERVLVHPAIKKALCEAAGADRKWLGKVRPIGGHYYHFHIRIGCPPGSTVCKPQTATTGDDGCAKEVDEWLARLAPPKGPPPPKPPGYKPPPPPPPLTMAQLPAECTAVLESGPDGVRQPLTAIKDEVPMGGMGEARSGAFVAGSALRSHIMRQKSADKAK